MSLLVVLLSLGGYGQTGGSIPAGELLSVSRNGFYLSGGLTGSRGLGAGFRLEAFVPRGTSRARTEALALELAFDWPVLPWLSLLPRLGPLLVSRRYDEGSETGFGVSLTLDAGFRLFGAGPASVGFSVGEGVYFGKSPLPVTRAGLFIWAR